MKKGKIIYDTFFTIIYIVGFMANLDGVIRVAQWLPFVQGISITLCVFGAIYHIRELIKA